MKKTIYTLLLVLIFCAAVFTLWWLIHLIPRPLLPPIPWYLILLFSLSMAFTWVEVLRIGTKKPLNCVKCMTGWIALILAFVSGAEWWWAYLFLGLFTGAMWSGLKMRYL